MKPHSQYTVAEFWNIRDIEIKKLAETGSDYYRSVRDFWEGVKEMPQMEMSPGRRSWLNKIEEDIENNWRDLWIAQDAEWGEDFL